MKRIIILFFSLALLTSCGSSKRSMKTAKTSETEATVKPELNKVIRRAKSFEGTPYKYGGTSKSGMDCSGLIYTCYLEEDIKLPRTSKAMSQYGKEIRKKDIDVGDLLFFNTSKSSRKINHVGLVVERKRDKIYFIHSTSSRGVIISSLDHVYWKKVFVMVRRVI